MEEVNNPFRKAGVVLLVIGIIDICAMIYCIANNISYSSSFNIFAVIAGVLLMKGSVKTARVVRWFSAFFVTAFVCMAVLFPATMPTQLLATQVELNPVGMIGLYAFLFIFTGVLAWVYKQLSSASALATLDEAGYNTGKPKSALRAALIILIFIGTVIAFMFNSESAETAKTLAKEQYGENYKYHLTSLKMSGNHGSAVVIAYNSEEIKRVKVKW